jgi:hypothetical protein
VESEAGDGDGARSDEDSEPPTPRATSPICDRGAGAAGGELLAKKAAAAETTTDKYPDCLTKEAIDGVFSVGDDTFTGFIIRNDSPTAADGSDEFVLIGRCKNDELDEKIETANGSIQKFADSLEEISYDEDFLTTMIDEAGIKCFRFRNKGSTVKIE